MSEAKHTPGPWTTDEADHDAPYQNIKIQSSNRTICTVWIDDAPVRDFNAEQQANSRRIVACVNACEGFSIEEIEGANLFKDSIESGNLINELLEALQRIIAAANTSTNDAATLNWIADTACAAIAKATNQ